MDPRHARYPFFEAARAAVEDADADLVDLATEGDPAVERAVERVEASLTGGTVGDPHRSTRTELLSYPVARVLVSLLDRQALVRRYAAAEARTAHERFEAELTGADDLASTSDNRLTMRALLAEFDLAGDVHGTTGEFDLDDELRVHVGAYLSLSGALSGDRWRLATRRLADGLVPVTGRELLTLLREAVRERVADGLPFEEVPHEIADALEPQVERLRQQLGDHRPPDSLDVLVPELFPPCMTALAGRALAGESLSPHARYALVAFLTSAGMTPGEVDDALPFAAGYQAERLGSEAGGGYAPPSCATMQSYGDGETDFGDCVAPDERSDRCETIQDPLSYYAGALKAADAPSPCPPDALADRL
jgi:DNA primase large subunit